MTLSEFHVPANLSIKILSLLRIFAREVGNIIPKFQLPSSLTDVNAPQISLLITNSSRLFFVISLVKTLPIILGGVDLDKSTQKMQLVNIEVAFEGDEIRIDLERLINLMFGGNAIFVLNLTQIAIDLQTMLNSKI